ncbi:MAG: hypothetical protein ACT4PW_00490 [Acidimicrobiia bacterium]
MRVTFIDTSVLCELLDVPGKSASGDAQRAELGARLAAGERFVIPITAVVETGNHIAQAKTGDRRAAARRLIEVLLEAVRGGGRFELHQVAWDEAFLVALAGGDSTDQTFIDLAGNGLMGGGDVAILVERDRFVATSGYQRHDVGIWTLEAVLGAYA